MERGKLPSRAAVGRLAARGVSLAIAVFAVAALCGFFLQYLDRHAIDSALVPFGGWQVDVTLVGIALVGLAVLAVGVVSFRRWGPRPGMSRNGQLTAATLAVVIGFDLAAGVHRLPDRLYNWAANHTAAAHRLEEEFARQTRAILGDATHPPKLRTPGNPATAAQAAPLLAPHDLGSQWRYDGLPYDTVGRPEGPGSEYSVHTVLTLEHWNGTLWVHDQDVFETVSTYVTKADARKALRSDIHPTKACSLPGPCVPVSTFSRSRIGALDVWRSPESEPGELKAVVLDRTTVMLLYCIVPAGVNARPAISGERILRAAIQRAERAG